MDAAAVHDSSYRSDDPPAYSEARAAGFEAGKALLAAAEEEQRFNDGVEWLRDSFSSGNAAGLPPGSSICRAMNPMDPDADPRVVSVHVFPLDPMTPEEAVRSGLFPSGRFARHVYEHKVREAGFVGQWRRELW